MKSPKQSKLFICSIVKNAEKGLKKNIPVIEGLFQYFNSVNVFIYENDSTDNTKHLLKDFEHRYPSKVKVSLNDNLIIPQQDTLKSTANPFFNRSRISRMVFLRNKYMEYVKEINWDGDYFLVVDLDVAQIKITNILESFNTTKDWDAISAYGYSLSPRLKERYHDTYAYRPYGVPYDQPQTESDIYGLNNLFHDEVNDLIPVSSAFGGLAIYRWEAIRGLKYKLEENQDNRVEVYCEHHSIYRQMSQRGYNRFYINKRMRLKYQEVNLSFIIHWLRLKLHHHNYGKQ